VRPCDSTVTDCAALGSGRNVDGLHGKTAHLTPQQLNDLVEFQKAPHNPVGSVGSTIQAGTLVLGKVVVDFGKKPGKGKLKVVGTATPGALPVDPAVGGMTVSVAVPDGDRMVMIELTAPAAEVKAKGGGKRFKYKAKTEQGKVNLTLKRTKSGDYKLVAKLAKADLAILRNGARDVTVALVAGDTQFARNRLLSEKKKGRVLALAKKGS
jgi:hypothetical protein